MVVLVNNKGYRWCNLGQVYFKGFFILRNGEGNVLYKGNAACEKLSEFDDYSKFCEFLKVIEGVWSIVIERDDGTWLAVDIARSLPLYYSTDGHIISDSAESIREQLGITKEGVDKDYLLELYANYYLFGKKTVYKQIEQLDLGESAKIGKDGVISKCKYFYHFNRVFDEDRTVIKKNISKAAYDAFERLKVAIGERPVVLSMSGGYDSRFVGCMLKNVGIDNVSCYTYGKSTSFEVIQSKKNADALGFRWECVEMTDELVANVLDDVGLGYLDDYNGHDFTAYMQNFVAVRKLHEDNWFYPNSVFITGLCGDMPTGEYLLPYNTQTNYNVDTAVDDLFSKAFMRYDIGDSLASKWKQEIKGQIESLPIKIEDYESWNQVVDSIYTGMCHAHWFLHMNTVHSYFGYEWLLPYWDSELLKVWYSVPHELKVNQALYEEWLLDEICKPYGLSQKKTITGYSKNPITKKIQYRVGGLINYVLLHLGVPFKRKVDFNNFAPLELELFKRIKTKDCINYQRSGMMQLLDQFLIERRYGSDNLKYVASHTKSID